MVSVLTTSYRWSYSGLMKKKNNLLLLGKQIIFDESEVLFDFTASKLTKQHQKL